MIIIVFMNDRYACSTWIYRDLHMQRETELWWNVIYIIIFFNWICRSRTFFENHEFAPRTGSCTLLECLTSSDTYFNRRDRRSKEKEGWLFAGDQNLIFIQSGGQIHCAWGCHFYLSHCLPFVSLPIAYLLFSRDRIEKNLRCEYLWQMW